MLKNSTVNMSLQYYVVNLLTFSTGSSYSWSSPVVPKLTGQMGEEMNPLDHAITITEKAWLVALVPFGAIFGCPVGGFLSTRFGKKKALIFSGIPLLASYWITTFPSDIIYYYIAKFLGGVGAGCCFTLVPLYVGESSAKTNRGLFGCFFGIFLKMGTCFSYLVGPYCSVQIFSLICSIPVLIFLIFFCLFFPETPYHLVSTGDIEGAEKALKKLRKFNSLSAINSELVEISAYIKDNEENKQKNIFSAFKDKAAMRSLIITSSILCFQQLSGIVLVISYMQTIFEESGSTIRADIASAAAGLTQVFVSCLTSLAIEKFGRRILLILSTAVISLSLLSIAVYFTLKNNGYEVQAYYWVPFTSIVAYFIAYCLGIGPVVWAMMGEMFDTNVKSLGSSIANCLSKVCAFLTTLVFPWITSSFGIEGSFYLLSFFMFLGFIFVVLFVPETKSKSFAEIKTMLDNKFLQIL